MWSKEHCSFLTYAASFGLERYFRVKQQETTGDDFRRHGAYVLDCALRDLFSRPMWEVEYRPYEGLVKVLLKSGVDVNQEVAVDRTNRGFQPLWCTSETAQRSNPSSGIAEAVDPYSVVPDTPTVWDTMTIWELYLHYIVPDSKWMTEEAKRRFASTASLLLSAGADANCRLPKGGLSLAEILKWDHLTSNN